MKGSVIYNNLDKMNIFKNFDEFIIKTQYFFLKYTFSCSGCNYNLNKEEMKVLDNYDKLIICHKCDEIYCTKCIEYLKLNNLNCLKCLN